jgi:hypothetical protein
LYKAYNPSSAELNSVYKHQAALPTLVKRMRERDAMFKLVDPRKRRMLLKLLTLRTWLGFRVVRGVDEEDAEV